MNRKGMSLIEVVIYLGLIPIFGILVFQAIKMQLQKQGVEKTYASFQEQMLHVSEELTRPTNEPTFPGCTGRLRGADLSPDSNNLFPIQVSLLQNEVIRIGADVKNGLFYDQVAVIRTNKNVGMATTATVHFRAHPLVDGQPLLSRSYTKDIDIVFTEGRLPAPAVGNNGKIENCAKPNTAEASCLAFIGAYYCNKMSIEHGGILTTAIAGHFCSNLLMSAVCAYPQMPPEQAPLP